MRNPLPINVLDQLSAGGGWLGSYLPGVGLLTAAGLVTAVAITVAIRRRSRGHRRGRITGIARATVLSIVVLSCTALGGAALVNAYAGYLPDTASLAGFAGLASAVPADTSSSGRPVGSVREVDLGDTALDVPPSTMWIYTPPGYRQQPARHYPVVYLFHGYPGTSADWFRAGRIAQTMDVLIAHRLVPAAIVVAPDLNGGGIHDTEGLDATHGPRIATWFTRDVVDWTDSHLRTYPDREHRIIGGMSSGGYAALDIALHHLDEFGAVLAQEPYGDPGQDALSLLGGSQAAFRAHSPVSYLPGMRFTRPLPVFCDVGADGDPHNVNRLVAELRADHQPVLFRVESDQHHTWAEARAGIAFGLLFAFRSLGGQPV
jgi:enterochelin esterase-like enzyme